MRAFTVPESAWPYIARQKGKSFNDTLGVKVTNYVELLQEQFALIAPYFPKRVKRILDIGCGVAGIDILLKNSYPDTELYLLDGDGDDPRTGWNEYLNAFNSRVVAEEFLAENGVVPDCWIDINTNERLEADLVISLASWGYHYPLHTYNVSGFCIADLRIPNEQPRGRIIKRYLKRNLCAWQQ